MLNCYEILGVDEAAGPAEIRRAYISLMKRYHPDAPGSDPASEAMARELNKAFWTLRSPLRRSGHDRMLREARKGKAPPPPPSMRPPPVQGRALALVQPRPQRAGRGLGLLIATLAITATFYAMQQPQRGERLWELLFGSPLTAVAQTSEPSALGSATRMSQLDSWNVDGAVSDLLAIVFESGVPGAERYSQRCFEEAAVAPSARLVDHCIAFDFAAALVDDAVARNEGRARSDFYSEQARAARLDQVLALLPNSAQGWSERKRDIERSAVSALAELGGPIAGTAQQPGGGNLELGAQ